LSWFQRVGFTVVVVVLGVLVLDSTCEPSVESIVPVIPYLATPAIVLDEAGLG
jgi:hypothetical protein